MSNPYSSDIESVNIGRFSTTLLNQSGARKVVRNVGGSQTTTYSLRKGTESFPSAPAIDLNNVGLVSGAYNENTYTAVLGYFLSRGATKSNASSMAALVIDSAKLNGTTPMQLLSYLPTDNKTLLAPETYPQLNILRDVSNQQELVSNIRNSKSFKSSSIKA
jgi:hypothetical protein